MFRARLAWTVVAVLAGSALLSPAIAHAYPNGGRATVTDPGQTKPLRHGGSATYFSLVLPRGAHCAGDAQHDGYRVFSYLIPHGVDPHVEDFRSTLPSRWYGMYNEQEYYMGLPAPGTGEIVDVPHNLVWDRLSPGLLIAPGQQTARWDAGLACVSGHYATQNTWSATFEFHRSPSDPGGFTFDVISSAGSIPQSGGLGGWAVIAFVAAALFLAGAVVLNRVGKRRGPTDGDGGEMLGGPVESHAAVGTVPVADGRKSSDDHKDRSLTTSGE